MREAGHLFSSLFSPSGIEGDHRGLQGPLAQMYFLAAAKASMHRKVRKKARLFASGKSGSQICRLTGPMVVAKKESGWSNDLGSSRTDLDSNRWYD
jgi:hypothetical protein